MITQPPFNHVRVRTTDADIFKKLTLAFGILAILVCVTGIIGNISGIIFFSSVCQGCKTLALSAALIWIFFGAVLIYTSTRPVGHAALIFLRSVIVIVAFTECVEIPLSLNGQQFIIESWSVAAGSALFGPLSSPISPVASVLIIVAAVGLFFCIDPSFVSSHYRHARETTVVAGTIIALAGFTLALSYLYGTPLLSTTLLIPIAALSAIAACCIGLGLITAAGSATVPACYFVGNSIRARLLRTFVALSIIITLCETLLFYSISAWLPVPNALIISSSLVIFIIVTSIVVGRVSGEIGQSLDLAEQELRVRNAELRELNTELKAAEEKLQQNIEIIAKNEKDLHANEQFLRETEKIAKIGGWMANPQTDYIQWTDGAYDIFEAPRGIIPGFTESLIYFSEKDRPLIRSLIEECLATGKPFTREFLITTGTGKKIWTELQGLRQVREEHRSSVIGTFQDISKRRLTEEKLRKERGKLEILGECARLLLGSENPEEIVQVIGERVMRHLCCHTFFNYLIDESGQRMRLNAYYGITKETAKGIEYLNLGEAVCGRVARDGERMLAFDILHTDDEATSLIRSFGTTGYACHPLICQGRTLGTLSFGTCNSPGFTDEELDLMQAVTDLVATAIARKKVEDTLRGTSQYLENLINYANAPIIVWDTEYRILRFNHAFEFLTGMTADTVIGQPLDILFPEKSRKESRELIKMTSSGERWESVEIPIRHVSGVIKTVLWNSANIYETDGVTISSTIAQGQDITERKIAEDKTIKTTSLLSAALDSTADGILVVGNAGNITGYNKKFCTIWGIPEHALDAADEMTALSFMAPQVADDREFTGRRNEICAHPGRESYDVVLLRDGRIFERYSKPQMIGNTIVGRVWSYRDITERLQAEKSLQESLEKFQIIATHSPDQILVQDKDLRYTQVINPQWGLTEQDMTGNTDYDIFSEEDAENLTKIKIPVLTNGIPYRDEMPLINSRGEKNYFSVSYVPKRNKSGEIDGIIGYFRNITEVKRANEKILAALAEKEILIREIHHRVKNNLQIISGLLDMTRSRASDPVTAGILTDMMLKIKTMAQIHTRLYESKQFDRIDMGAQIRDMVTDLASIYGKSGPGIACDVDTEAIPLTVEQAIPCALAVNEILSNSFKHAFKGRMHGTIRVSARQDDGFIRICIQDNGIGIQENVDPYHSSSLGLKLIRRLVLQLGGTLSITSNSGGTQVNIDVPREKER